MPAFFQQAAACILHYSRDNFGSLVDGLGISHGDEINYRKITFVDCGAITATVSKAST
jgi:hypothetical protein